MARDIPMDRPLTRADREYLEMRGQYAMVARLDQNYPQEDPNEQPLAEGSGNANVDLLVQENRALQDRLRALEVELAAKSQEPDTADGDADAGEQGETLPPYSEWKKDDLIAEAEARGLSKSGSKEELAKRLDDYDAAQ